MIRRALRTVPGKREVFDASWNGRHVVAKVFCHAVKARLHQWRERRGLRRLAERNIQAPVLLFSGRTDDGRWAVVTEWIQGGRTGHELWTQAETAEQKLAVLRAVTAELGRQHAKGVVQADVHLNNFMLAGDTVYALDVAQMRFQRRPLGRRISMKYLAHLLAYVPSKNAAGLDMLAGVYAAERHWQWDSRDSAGLRRLIPRIRRGGIKRQLKKCLRTSSAHVRIATKGYRGVLDRQCFEEGSAGVLVQSLDERMQAGQILKNGNTCFVSRIVWNGQDVVVKRYNHKGFWHSLRHTLKGSRARRSWLNATRLRLLRIPTAGPIGYIDEWRGLLLWQSYFVMHFVPGTPVSSVFQSEQASSAQKHQVHEQVVSLLQRMADHGISHGDMKHPNILFNGDQIVLMDLDAMRVGGTGHLWRHRYQRDVDRYLRDLSGLSITSIPSQGAR
ncbi:lipopolysaccharide kinase InaA family protein [Anaerobaca lacustris]|uniref:Lipopolysaccharide kinase InaA family protein n=1 Tax=Anaerobaca lacustris TaxID=3044600 RepID=A0AAW6TZS7_9BACT|nr:lipopolysaccharide kinase InaA family protein [Sedimentisphaerales bacterium M17dextr]MDI9432600.1 lipopolysaccharide kinase InaA family protein [Planctomycetota bacterium]